MLHRPANRIRPTLEALEVREVYFAGIALGIPISLHKVAPIGPFGMTHFEPHKAPVVSGADVKQIADLHQADSVITLRNETATTIRFRVQWPGSAETTWHFLSPGQAERVTFRQVELVRLNLTAIVQFAPEADGTGVHKVQVASGTEPVGPGGTSEGDGRVYVFRPDGSGVALYSAPRQ
jgi:hypothetical protein